MEARKKFQVQRGRSIKSFDKIVPILWRFTRYFGKWVRMYALFHPITFFDFSRINLSRCLLSLLKESDFFSFKEFFDAFFSEEQPLREEYTFVCCLYCIFPIKGKQMYHKFTSDWQRQSVRTSKHQSLCQLGVLTLGTFREFFWNTENRLTVRWSSRGSSYGWFHRCRRVVEAITIKRGRLRGQKRHRCRGRSRL